MYDHLSDLDLFSWLLWGEAEGEGALGQLGVAWTVLNRVAAQKWRWGYTISEVILCPYQYTGLQRIPAYVRQSHWAGPPPLDTGSVAELVIAGRTIDPVAGATHFHATWLPKPWDLPEVARINNHIFYREN